MTVLLIFFIYSLQKNFLFDVFLHDYFDNVYNVSKAFTDSYGYCKQFLLTLVSWYLICFFSYKTFLIFMPTLYPQLSHDLQIKMSTKLYTFKLSERYCL